MSTHITARLIVPSERYRPGSPHVEEATAGAAWYAIQVHSQCETQACHELSLRGFEVFLPQQTVRRKWSDRVKVLEVPLFPGYLFGKFHMENRVRILNLPGVAQILGVGPKPVAISEQEISAVQAMVASRVAVSPWPYLRAGHKVRIDHGPLAGVEGIVIRAEDGKARVVVSVTLLQRSVAAEIDRQCICAVS